MSRLLPEVRWQQHHVAIQRAWFQPGQYQWYPTDRLANAGLQRLGDAGFNLMAIPAGLNNVLGRASAGTAGFAGLVYGSIAYGVSAVIDRINDPGFDPEGENASIE